MSSESRERRTGVMAQEELDSDDLGLSGTGIKQAQPGLGGSRQNACLVCSKPWVRVPAPQQPGTGTVGSLCHPSTLGEGGQDDQDLMASLAT